MSDASVSAKKMKTEHAHIYVSKNIAHICIKKYSFGELSLDATSEESAHSFPNYNRLLPYTITPGTEYQKEYRHRTTHFLVFITIF
jgi:hypothetical protein